MQSLNAVGKTVKPDVGEEASGEDAKSATKVAKREVLREKGTSHSLVWSTGFGR
jgi:hypothetical protein